MDRRTIERVRDSLSRDGWGGVGVRSLDGVGVATLGAALPDTEDARLALERAWLGDDEADRTATPA